MGGTEMKKKETMNEPTFVYRDNTIADNEYVEWLSELKQRFQSSQAKAAVRVNTAMLEYYWNLGRDIIQKQAESKWGSGFFNQLSQDMRTMFPEETGFSVTNLKYMKRWYQFYYEQVVIRQRPIDEIRHQLGDELFQQAAEELSPIRHQLGDQLEMPEIFGRIPWRHHVEIFTKSQSVEEALFYVNKVAEEGWSRSWLEDQMAAKRYQSQGAAITNFDKTLPAPQSELAKEMLKDEYNFEFLTMKAKYDERDLEEALVNNITRFLLELGKGFAFVGRQMELRMDDETTFFPDLVFYHIPQKRYVIIELKAVKFEPEFAGKLNFYVTAADELLRGEGDNPSVGLVICKTAKKTIVEWSLKDINKPLGVASYQLREVVDRTVAELELRKKQLKEDKE
jgi:predicted nuclease of restriction endonuclease-like (RecB) superfamily